MYLFKSVFSFSSDIYPGVELLDQMVVLFLVFWEPPIVAALIYIPTNYIQGFPFLHILISICYLWSFFFFYFWLCWFFVAAHRLSLVAVSGGYSSLQCTGLSLRWLLLLWSMASRHAGFRSCGTRALERRLSSCGART